FSLGLLSAIVAVAVATYVLCEFLEKLARAKNVKPLKHGAQFGLALGVLEAVPYLLLPVSVSVLTMSAGVAVASSVTGFAAAAWVYQHVDPAPSVRGGHHSAYLSHRARL
ncbi:MAG: hypothetical protein Q8P02_03980, partial [Candidatus Micrarchaeota archaeon]|nr:hypothetical protein [Candidatus Micrarchaeota archaeon]